MPVRPPVFRPPNREAAEARGSAAARGYGRRWQKARVSFLIRNPVCCCGCGHPATEVDHIVPHRGDEALFWDTGNWQPMTKACHSAKTARGG